LDQFGCTLGIYCIPNKTKTSYTGYFLCPICWNQLCQFKQVTYLVDLQHRIVTISVLVNMSSRKSISVSFARFFHVHMNGQIKCQTSLVGYGTGTLDWRPSLVIRKCIWLCLWKDSLFKEYLKFFNRLYDITWFGALYR
jgi:hypothetical protein